MTTFPKSLQPPESYPDFKRPQRPHSPKIHRQCQTCRDRPVYEHDRCKRCHDTAVYGSKCKPCVVAAKHAAAVEASERKAEMNPSPPIPLAIDHGTADGYRDHIRQGSIACDPCRAASKREFEAIVEQSNIVPITRPSTRRTSPRVTDGLTKKQRKHPTSCRCYLCDPSAKRVVIR